MRLIDVEALIDDCKKYLNKLNPSRDGKECTRIHWLIGILSSAPTIELEQKWISCSERLPEVGKEVLVCYDFKGHRSVLVGSLYGDGKFHGYDDEYLTVEGRKYRKAVAWMPLPEPWEEGNE